MVQEKARHPFRDLTTVVGEIAVGDVFEVDVKAEDDSFLTFLSADMRVLFCVKFAEEATRLNMIRNLDGTWEVLGSLPVSSDACRVRIEFGLDLCEVTCNQEKAEAFCSISEIFRIGGRGDFHNEKMDLPGLKEAAVFVRRTLLDLPEVLAEQQSDLIFDIGMHNGNDTDFYLKKGFRVVALDANPVLCAAAARRFQKEIQENRLFLFNLGLGPQAGFFSFYVNQDHSEWSSFRQKTASRGHPVIEIDVEAVTMDMITARFGVPYYAKVDIEGYDRFSVVPLAQAKVKPKYISFENGHRDVFEILVEQGYDRFKLINQAKVEEHISASPAREGVAVPDYHFKPGSSGLFGEETPGEWMPADAMRTHLVDYEVSRAEALSKSFYIEWFDLHAARP
ncbi:MAG: FkbM family methyltransferase [Alphaproteobacteria bacterium]|nr:FkbM family methyltransferase [Alphaproteobacteria bacterium]